DLQVDPARMKANLDLTSGLIMSESLTMALAPKIGRPEAYRIIQAISKQVTGSGKNMRQAALEDGQVRAVLPPEEIDNALDPTYYLGSTDAFIDRALAAYHKTHM
ncbi:MAG TPA: hypothetical protein VFQ36_09875, partial [Ktedonobacteraceae bacterium]|nr:hypothetical protein [Ktedonobacteraceae bacterium]